jgi:hypothetical protein
MWTNWLERHKTEKFGNKLSWNETSVDRGVYVWNSNQPCSILPRESKHSNSEPNSKRKVVSLEHHVPDQWRIRQNIMKLLMAKHHMYCMEHTIHTHVWSY